MTCNPRVSTEDMHTKKGFTLIEIMVAVSIFSIVMLVAAGSLLSIVDASRKSQSLKSVMDNFNLALESISRSARVGSLYHCQPGEANPASVPGNLSTPQSCSSGGTLIAFEAHDGDPDDDTDQIIYRLNGTALERSLEGGAIGTFIAVTASEIQINELRFYVLGAEEPDGLQPRIIITVQGEAGVSERTRSEFSVQTSITQRILDLP